MSPSLFTRIIQGELPAHIVAEDADFIAFLDIAPLQEGHTLVVPKQEIDDLFDQPEEVLAALLPFAKTVAKRLKAAIPCKRIGLAVVGLEVPHTHLHLLPIHSVSDMDFTRPKQTYSDKELAACAARIRAAQAADAPRS